MKLRPLLAALALSMPASAFAKPPVEPIATPTGQLSFALKTAGPALHLGDLDKESAYAELEAALKQTRLDGPQVLRTMRSLDPKLESISEAITRRVVGSVDPKGAYADDFYAMLDANPWASPIFQYARGDDSDDEQIYVTVNRELRDAKPDSAKVSGWTKKMREALWHLPSVAGLSFRGTRLTKERIAHYYPEGGPASDAAFISTSLEPSTALRFADPKVNGEPVKGTVAVLLITRGKNGRPISAFAQMMDHEQEILFANGTPFTVAGKSEIFADKELGPTQVIYLLER